MGGQPDFFGAAGKTFGKQKNNTHDVRNDFWYPCYSSDEGGAKEDEAQSRQTFVFYDNS